MAEITIKIEIAGELKDGDKYGIEDVVSDSLRNSGYDVKSVRVS